MKIGTLVISVFAAPANVDMIDNLHKIMHSSLKAVDPLYYFDYKRFLYLSSNLIWNIKLTEFWKTDRIYNTLIKYLNEHFFYWEVTITLSIKEEGG